MTPIPKFLSHLPVYGNYPVPYIVYYSDGRPDFRINDQEKQLRCYQNNWCAICGKRMFKYWFIGGEASMESGMFTDGPMHEVCAEFAIKTCPFLSGDKTSHSKRDLPLGVPIAVVEDIPMERPKRMAMREARRYVLGKLKLNLIYQVTKWQSKPVWF